jgi:hypothetical protein
LGFLHSGKVHGGTTLIVQNITIPNVTILNGRDNPKAKLGEGERDKLGEGERD